ncbi:hypothetical protein [Deminuibacter soli]|uniref:Lipoprotein n=1 Tax=Deminuibacter soli TaxID=2291815 RepID=A0A3E1NJ18_9BACT|nr:hypothetical protein [Deminuibacter soli]RFM27778.1 hypothetical protein DXN05_13845 [Deminuibacter soli]
MNKLLILTTTLLFISCSPFKDMPESSEQELKSNYNSKHKEIAKLKRYFNSITPKDLEIYIEFINDQTIDLSIYHKTIPPYPKKVLFQQWGFNPYNGRQDSPVYNMPDDETSSLDTVKDILNWKDATFRTIKAYLDNANCISVTNGEPANVGFRRSGMGMYFYNLFNAPLNDSLKKTYNDSCRYRLYNDTMAFEYGGGAIGPQCFPDK